MPSQPLVPHDEPEESSDPHAEPSCRGSGAGRRIAAGLLLGLGLGGFVDGIVLHQILQWHHMLTDYGSYDAYPRTGVRALEENTLWDGLFHVSTWLCVLVGALLLASDFGRRARLPSTSFVGLLLIGWGSFNVVEGVIDHHILTIHHVRDDVDDPFLWDVGFLALGAFLIGAGSLLYRHGRSGLRPDHGGQPVQPPIVEDRSTTSPRRVLDTGDSND